jgi:hypothetical protein
MLVRVIAVTHLIGNIMSQQVSILSQSETSSSLFVLSPVWALCEWLEGCKVDMVKYAILKILK